MLDHYFSERGIAMADTLGGGRTPAVFTAASNEHLATRRCAGLFDFSFMGCWEVAGRDAERFLQRLQTRDLRVLRPGTLCYTLLCREDGTVVNDATVWRHSPSRFWIFTGNRQDIAHLCAHTANDDMALRELSGKFAVIAIQGPRSKTILDRLVAPGVLRNLRYFSFCMTPLCERPAWIARLGYSGEPGYEVIVPAADAVHIWQRILAEGRRDGLQECGFDAANSLRIESGFILFSRELQAPVTPYQLGLERFIDLRRDGFIGHEALRAQRDAVHRRLVGIRLDPYVANGRSLLQAAVARVTSESYSPIFHCDLALGFVDRDTASPGQVVYSPEGRRGRVHRLPFYDPPRSRPRNAAGGQPVPQRIGEPGDSGHPR
jgi:aminomethyltransferase